ncbi:hypothetical protein Cni_G20247 [Canna indica]|uniref:Uncharacterized protein n=1 Tax=Canna indica TaxID=4628 RepID=A0AAQ3KMV1_9LILI|nr:hypothetical protein Cni_G20247 [Canna indica]
MKVHHSALIINKFVDDISQRGMTECIQTTPNDDNTIDQIKHKIVGSTQSVRQSSPTTTTAAAAMVAASTLRVSTEDLRSL